MRHLKSALAVIGAVVILVLAGNTIAIAANGQGFLIGKINSGTKITTLKRTTAGTALKIQTKSASNAPLQVNGSGKVANLNADKLDGLDSSVLKNRTYVYTKAVSAQTSVSVALPLPAGTYNLAYSAYLTGGGSDGSQAYCYFFQTSPTAYYGEERGPTLTGSTPSFSGAATVTVTAARPVTLFCGAPTAFTTLSSEPIQITATPTTLVGGQALRTAPSSARAAH